MSHELSIIIAAAAVEIKILFMTAVISADLLNPKSVPIDFLQRRILPDAKSGLNNEAEKILSLQTI
jgi:hypothetical protein